MQLFYNNTGVQLVWSNSPFAKPALENDFVNFVERIIIPQNTNNWTMEFNWNNEGYI